MGNKISILNGIDGGVRNCQKKLRRKQLKRKRGKIFQFLLTYLIIIITINHIYGKNIKKIYHFRKNK